MSTKLTLEQRAAIALFRVHRAGAMKLAGRWVWINDIRRDPSLATRFIRDRCDGTDPEHSRDAAMLREWLAPEHGRRQ
jgi:hypothetical protein